MKHPWEMHITKTFACKIKSHQYLIKDIIKMFKKLRSLYISLSNNISIVIYLVALQKMVLRRTLTVDVWARTGPPGL